LLGKMGGGVEMIAPLRPLLQSVIALALLSCTLQPASSEQKKEATVPPILKESWAKYVERFIQADGRVIDHKAGGISTSEGQAYAMLRAVWMQDRATFD